MRRGKEAGKQGGKEKAKSFQLSDAEAQRKSGESKIKRRSRFLAARNDTLFSPQESG
jgi:hypothetical protein